jgi:hypothetical protein
MSGGWVLRRRGWTFVVALVLAWVLLVPATRTSPARGAVGGRPNAFDVPANTGYWLGASDGGVFSFGSSRFQGSMGGQRLNRQVVGMAATSTGRGYWLVASDGGIFSFGDALFYGSTGSIKLNQPIVGMAPTPTGRGYLLVAADGGIFAFGDATFAGSTGGQKLPAPIVGISMSPSGLGYWLVGAKGDVYAFGDAPFLGAMGGTPLAKPVVGMASAPGGRGYWLVASDGGIFSFGDATFLGSTGGMALNRPIVGMAASPRGTGYWLVASDGGIFSYGDATFFGSTGSIRLSQPIVGMVPPPVRIAPDVATFFYPWYANPADGGGVWRHWDQGGHSPPSDIGSDYYPVRGAYSSQSPTTLDSQMAEIAGAGITTIVTSWWGRGSFEDNGLPAVVSAARAHGLHVAVHVEPYSGRTPAMVAGDIRSLKWLNIDEFWVYEAMGPPVGDWASQLASIPDVRLFAETGNLTAQVTGRFATYARQAGFDGVYTYDPVRYSRTPFAFACGAARQRRLLCAPSVAPGELDTRTPPLRTFASREGGARYERQWSEATDGGADLISITSYNEWHEGTQIEPATPYCFPDVCSPGYEGDYGRSGAGATIAYLDATRAYAARYRANRP